MVLVVTTHKKQRPTMISLESNEEEKALYLATSGCFSRLSFHLNGCRKQTPKDSTIGLNCPREAFICDFGLKISTWSVIFLSFIHGNIPYCFSFL
jgi:hypothetical protein